MAKSRSSGNGLVASALSLGLALAGVGAGPGIAGPAEANLVANPGFEDGLTGWAAGNGGVLRLSDEAYSGQASGHLSERTQFFHGLKGTLIEPLDHDGSYRVTARIKHTDGAPSEPFGFAFCPASGGCVAARNAIKPIPQGDWSEYSLEFVPSDSPNYGENHVNTVFGHFQIETPWSSTVPFLVDNVSVVRLDAGDEPGGQPTTQGSVEDVLVKELGDHNPLTGHKFGADPHHVIFQGRLYIYATSDDQQYRTAAKRENGLPLQDGGYDRINTLEVISTDDMVNWVDHGTIPVAGPDGVAKWAGNSWAPAAISGDPDGDGKEEVYLFFCNGGSGTGVIVGGSPLGPWTDPNGRMLISQNNPVEFPRGMWLFDPEVFVDDDGQPFLYFGGNWDHVQDPYHPKSTRVVKLDPNDYSRLADPSGAGITEIDAPGMFEASSMFKKDGRYYYSYSSNFVVGDQRFADKAIEGQGYPGRGEIAYMISDSPMELTRGQFAGTAFASHGKWFPKSGGNNHSDIFSYRGKDYFAYHTQTRGIAWGDALNDGRTVNFRSVHLDEISFNEDGTIREVEGTRSGVEQIQDFDPFRTFEAETLAWQSGIATLPSDRESVEFPQHNGAGNTVLTQIDDGDFAGLSSVALGARAERVRASVKPLTTGGQIEVRLDSPTGRLVATIDVNAPVGEWTEVSAPLAGASGTHDVFFVFAGPEGERLMEVDNWTFVAGTQAEPEPTDEPTDQPTQGTMVPPVGGDSPRAGLPRTGV